jgi:glycosyltransferase involved in cell wall biosynthesis
MSEPTLSICVPSRNRQIYFQETIKSLLACQRDDVEFVLADNSDDASVMDKFIEALGPDVRVRYLPSTGTTLSMMDNWERAVTAAKGRWVAAIGDDDYLDPELAAFILNLEIADPDADALAWNGFSYIWPEEGSPVRQLATTLSTTVTRMPKHLLMRKAFMWQDAAMVPLCGYSIYHGAHSRRLIDRMRKLSGGRYFEFPVIDYENAFKAILLGNSFYHSARPFSVLGVCPLSNSKAAGSLEAQDRVQANFNKELGWNLDDDPLLADMPFRPSQGITSCVFAVQHWLSKRYRIPHTGYEINLVKAMEANCRLYSDRMSFDITAHRYRAALAEWRGGEYLPHFAPQFVEPKSHTEKPPIMAGIPSGDTLYFSDTIEGVATPGALFGVLSGLLARPAEIAIPA